MADINDLSVTDGSNTARFPEGMLAGSVNNAARALEGILARWHKDNNGSLATGGTSTAITVTLNQSSIAAWYDGLTFAARITTTCGATPTINPTGSAALGAKSLYWAGTGTQLAADDLTTTAVATFMYEATSDKVYVFASTPVAAASETVAGKAELATQAETNTGTDDARIVTPAKLTNWTAAGLTGVSFDGSADHILIRDGSNSSKLAYAGPQTFESTQAQQETGTTDRAFVTPRVQQFHPSAAKCWGYVTVAAGTPTLAANYNLTSITDSGAGDLTVTVATDFADTNFCVGCLSGGLESARSSVWEVTASRAVGSFVVNHGDSSGDDVDPASWNVFAFGDQ